MLTISAWPRRLREFLLTHPLYKSPKDAMRCLAFTASSQLTPILLAEEDDVALGVSGVHHLRDFSFALPVLENALRTIETRQFVCLDLFHYDLSFVG